MTRQRIYGSDTDFCAWVRKCGELPSYSQDFGFVASDNDLTVHNYMRPVDGIGTREVQGIMQIEVKTRSGVPSMSQIDTLSKLNVFHGRKKLANGQNVVFFGVFILSMSGTNPDNSDVINWGVLPLKSAVLTLADIKWKTIDREMVVKILRFDVHPRSLEKNALRRHHKTQEIVEVEMTPLKFECDKRIVKRS